MIKVDIKMPSACCFCPLCVNFEDRDECRLLDNTEIYSSTERDERCPLINCDEPKTISDTIRNYNDFTLALYLHSWQVENRSVDEIKELLSENAPYQKGGK